MTYKKRFVNSAGVMSPISGANSARGSWNDVLNQEGNQQNVSFRNYMSRLPEVYVGHPNRIERYNQYEMMDVDAEINACLDIIAEFNWFVINGHVLLQHYSDIKKIYPKLNEKLYHITICHPKSTIDLLKLNQMLLLHLALLPK